LYLRLETKEQTMAMPKNLAIRVLAVWLILMGALQLLHVSFTYERTLLDALAIAAGVLLLLGK
jgi:hypothetical protein